MDVKKCGCCNANLSYFDSFKPYSDKPWKFQIYDCSSCNSRQAFNFNDKSYHEYLYDTSHNYSRFSLFSTFVKNCITKNRKRSLNYVFKSFLTYNFLINALDTDNSKSVLEIGCSTGFLTAFLNFKGYDAWGVDISKKAINIAKDRFGNTFGIVPHKSLYDYVIHSGTIGCVENPKEFISDYLKVLKPGGKMIFNAPFIDSINRLKTPWLSTPPPDLRTLFTEKAILKIFANHNVKIDFGKEYVNQKPLIHYPLRYHSDLNFIQKFKYNNLVLATLLKNMRSYLGKRNYLYEYGLFVMVTKL